MVGDMKDSTQDFWAITQRFPVTSRNAPRKFTATVPGISGAGTSFPDEVLLSRSPHNSQAVRTSTRHTLRPAPRLRGGVTGGQTEPPFDWPTFCAITDLERLGMLRSYPSTQILVKRIQHLFSSIPLAKDRKIYVPVTTIITMD